MVVLLHSLPPCCELIYMPDGGMGAYTAFFPPPHTHTHTHTHTHANTSTGRADISDSQRGLLQPLEGLHTLLRPSGSPHGAHLYCARADELVVQGACAGGPLQGQFPLNRDSNVMVGLLVVLKWLKKRLHGFSMVVL